MKSITGEKAGEGKNDGLNLGARNINTSELPKNNNSGTADLPNSNNNNTSDLPKGNNGKVDNN